MFEHAFDGYKTFAFPGDELKPVSKSKTNSLQELGANAGDRKYFDEEYDGIAMSLIGEFKHVSSGREHDGVYEECRLVV